MVLLWHCMFQSFKETSGIYIGSSNFTVSGTMHVHWFTTKINQNMIYFGWLLVVLFLLLCINNVNRQDKYFSVPVHFFFQISTSFHFWRSSVLNFIFLLLPCYDCSQKPTSLIFHSIWTFRNLIHFWEDDISLLPCQLHFLQLPFLKATVLFCPFPSFSFSLSFSSPSPVSSPFFYIIES